jgi:hypothetical protein
MKKIVLVEKNNLSIKNISKILLFIIMMKNNHFVNISLTHYIIINILKNFNSKKLTYKLFLKK